MCEKTIGVLHRHSTHVQDLALSLPLYAPKKISHDTQIHLVIDVSKWRVGVHKPTRNHEPE